MNPDQPGLPPPPSSTPSGSYDFIVNPENPQKKGLSLGGDSFITKIVVILGGAVLVIIVLTVVVNLLFGGRNNTETLVGLTQSQQEIIRIGAASKGANSQQIKNAAINTQLAIKSHQQVWLASLAEDNRQVPPEELNLKKDPSVDSKLQTAEQTSTFDTTYGSIMKSQLQAYVDALKIAYEGTSNKPERNLLSKHYSEAQLLLQQWPN